MRVPSVDDVDLATLAPPLRHHAALPGGTNVNVVEILEPGLARIRSWERGVEGETLCCGTGCAVAAAWLAHTEGPTTWRLRTAAGDTVTVSLVPQPGGGWRDLWLTGPVRLDPETAPD
jgi:diaminopimelate epimerase